MTRFKVTTPAGKLTAKIVGVNFADGVAEVDSATNRRALDYFRRSGYKVEALDEPEDEAPAKLTAAEKKAAAAAAKAEADAAKKAEEDAAKAAAAAAEGGSK